MDNVFNRELALKGADMSKFRKFLCNILGWHRPSNEIGHDGCSFHSVCKYCGKEIMQDSQGNWF